MLTRSSSLVFVTLTPLAPTTRATLKHAIDVLAVRDDRWRSLGSPTSARSYWAGQTTRTSSR
jgi:hypothetical protein